MRQILVFLFSSLLLVSSCDTSDVPDVSAINSRLEIGHFDHFFFTMDSSNLGQDLVQLKKDFPDFFEFQQDDSILVNRFYDAELRELYSAVDSIYADTEALDLEIKKAFQYFYHYLPNQDTLRVFTWISNFENIDPIVVSGNTLLIALDLYLGKESPFYKTAPDYIKDSFDESYILADLFHYYFAANIPFSSNNTLLASMIHYGKLHYLSSMMLPDSEQDIIMCYPKTKMDWCLTNEANIWAYFIENKLLFSSHQQNKQRFIEDAPFSKFYTSFDSESPGRIGQWIGWRIVNSYMLAHPEISLTELITEQDAQKILRESRYKPKQ